MNEPSLITRQRALLHDLIQRAAERASAEPAIETAYQEQVDSVENDFTDGREAVSRRLAREQEENERDVEQVRVRVEAAFKVEQDTANREFIISRGKIMEREQEEK